MKNLDEMTHKEIVALTEEDIMKLIDLRCAEGGVRLTPELPDMPERPEITEDLIGYEIAGVFTTDQEFAKKVQIVMRENSDKLEQISYDWSISSDHKFLKEITGDDRAGMLEISERLFFSLDKYARNKEAIKTYKKLREVWDDSKKEYDTITSGRGEISRDIRGEYGRHLERDRELERMRLEFARYVDLSKGDKEIAISFFSKAYGYLGDDMRELVNSELGIKMLEPVEDKVEEDNK